VGGWLVVAGLASATAQESGVLWGFADLHTHQFANPGFGGVFFHSAPFDARYSEEDGSPIAAGEMERALPPCDYTRLNNPPGILLNALHLPPLLLPIIGQSIHGPLGALDPVGLALHGGGKTPAATRLSTAGRNGTTSTTSRCTTSG
jgi:hypothetical protein